MTKKTKVILIGFPQATVVRDISNAVESSGHTVKILDPDTFLKSAVDDNEYMVCITRDLELRQQIINKLDTENYRRFTFIHKTAEVFKDSEIAPGSFIAPFALIGTNVTVESDCIIGPYCMISHDSTLGQGSIMHPGSMIAGSVTIGKYCKFNIRSTVIDHVSVCDLCEIGAGSMLTKNVAEPGVYIGSPARRKQII